MNTDGQTVKATETSFRILETIRDGGGAGVSELAREVELSKSAVYKHLKTLEGLGYLVRSGDDYFLSNRFHGLAKAARDHVPVSITQDVVENLAETTGQVSNFVVHEGNHGVYVVCVGSYSDSSKANEEGDVAPLHATAGGKAILAFLPEEERNRIFETTDLQAFTEETITDRRELELELQSVRDRRTAFDREEFQEGYQCVASPVLNAAGEPVGAICVSGETANMSGMRLAEDVTGLVISAAKSIENELLSENR